MRSLLAGHVVHFDLKCDNILIDFFGGESPDRHHVGRCDFVL